MNIGEIKSEALRMAQSPGKYSGRNAILYFNKEVNNYYSKKTLLNNSRECAAKWKNRYYDAKNYMSSVKKRLSMLGFDTKKVFKEE